MATCIGDKGRALPCNDNVGGIKAAYLIERGTMTPDFDITKTNVLTDLGAVTAYQWDVDVKSSSSLVQTLTQALGTTSVNQVVTLGLKKPEWSTDNEIKLWAAGQPHIVVHYNSGRAVLVGFDFGSNIDTAESNSGAAIGDPNIYTITVSADTLEYAYDLTMPTTSDPFAGMVTPVTVVPGTDVEPA